ncbi:MAG: folylpolyglutamate synthase/dihydrofolate synthase family protein [Thermodesulfobacteriota bacterium]|nr:folylpolyglutamate synthase/dihydrofolate synthase family protein [Thermodesulfobacteriota bacterium]
MNFEQAWSFLDELQFFKIKLGLDSMGRFLDLLDQPQLRTPYIHVAGTNGKGSVSVILLTLLANAGYKVGLYTSPHLSSVRERFRINNNYISEEDFAESATEIKNILDGRQITYFEFTTALAMLWFANEEVDLAILETGLGGRLDATNVITPLVSVITNVSMDHEAYLGNTLVEVAGEKAGIIKEGIPLISGVGPDESRDVIVETCRQRQAPLFLLGRDFEIEKRGGNFFDYAGIKKRITRLSTTLRGEHQLDNTALCLATLEILSDKGFEVSDEVIYQGLPEVFWPGRLEYFSLADDGVQVEDSADHSDASTRRYLLDGAHNPAGVSCLKKSLEDDFSYSRLIMVWAGMADKDLAKTLAIIAPLCDILIFCRPEAERSATPEQLRKLLPAGNRAEIMSDDSVSAALEKAREQAEPADLICVAGSLYLIGAARAQLLGELVG